MRAHTNCRPRKKKKMMKESEFNDGDLISKLPDPLLHHIFSFLDMKFVIQTCVLSRRWRDLWISQPIMNFDEEVYNPSIYSDDHLAYEYDSADNPNCKYYYTAFVEKALFLHSTSKIHTFRLRCKDYCQGTTVGLDGWMPILDRRKVEFLDLQIEMTEDHSIFELPESFFKCRSLTTLKLDFGPKNDCGFLKIVEDEEYDIKSSLTKLKTMHLRSIWLLGGISDLISMCRNLETLVISKCSLDMEFELSISHFQLKHLVIENIKKTSIMVFAPRLTSFSCRDYPISDYSFESTHSLVEADIDTDYYSTKSGLGKITHSRNMNKCLRELHKVRSLTLSAWLLQLAFQFPDDWYYIPINQFYNLRFLTLKTSLSISQIRATKNLLEKCPHLEALVLKMTEPPLRCVCVGEEEKNWEAKLAPKCMMYQLKFVEIWNVQASVNELEFLKFLLKNATILEKLVVHSTFHEQSNNAGEFRRFSENLRSFGGISSRITISF